MERFKLEHLGDLMWKVTDSETGFSIDFREGLFNETQKVNVPQSLTEEQAAHTHTTMREIGDWMAQNHYNVCMCDKQSRCSAIWTLCREKYWLILADALNGVIIDWSDEEVNDLLFDEIDDTFRLGSSSIETTEAERTNLLGAISLLDDMETREVINIVTTFWEYKSDTDIDTWARDLLWWPAWCPEWEEDDED